MMPKMKPIQVLPVVVLSFATSLVLLHAQDATKDFEQIQGMWLVSSLAEKGKAVPKEEVTAMEVRVEKDVFTVTEKGKVIAKYQLKVDPAKTPKSIDFTHLIGEDKGKTELGIYVLEKDSLTISLSEGKKARPTDFKSNDYDIIVLKRKPAKDAK